MADLLTAEMAYLRTIAMRFYEECNAAGLGTDDLAQETALRARSIPNLPKRESDRRRYLHRVMANLLHDQLDAARAIKRGGGRISNFYENRDYKTARSASALHVIE